MKTAQDPKPQATGLTAPNVDSVAGDTVQIVSRLKDLVTKSLMNKEIDALLGDSTPIKQAKNESLSNALAVAREQELHNAAMAQEKEKLTGLSLKNESQVFKMELEKQKAAASGLVVQTQDPKPQDPKKKIVPTTEWTDIPIVEIPQKIDPTTGMASTLLTAGPKHDTNFSRALFDALNDRKKTLAASGVINAEPGSEADKQFQWIQSELRNTLGRIDEKHLEFSPLGQPGQMIGGLLDVISGPLDIGTTIFGGAPSAMQKAQVLIQAANSVSPIVRAGLQDALGRDRMERTAEQQLARIGMGRVRGHLNGSNDTESADLVLKTGIDINTLLGTSVDTQMHFGSEATSGLGDAFRAYQNVVSATQRLATADLESIASVESDLRSADETMRKHIQKYFANGGKPEDFTNALASAQQVINSRYQQPLKYTPGDYREANFNALQGAVAKEFTDQLSQFEAVVTNDLPMIEDNIATTRRGAVATKLFKDPNVAVPPIVIRKSEGFGKIPAQKGRQIDREEYVSLLAAASAKMTPANQDKLNALVKDLFPSRKPDTKAVNAAEEHLLTKVPSANLDSVRAAFDSIRDPSNLKSSRVYSAFMDIYSKVVDSEPSAGWSGSGVDFRNANIEKRVMAEIEKKKGWANYEELKAYAKKNIGKFER